MNLKYIAIRVDASNQIGTGHFMRCLTLAEGLQKCGMQIHFISRNLPRHLYNMVTAKGMGFTSIENGSDESTTETDELAHSSWLGASQSQDAHATINALSNRKWDWLIIDHYALDSRWESMLRKTTNKILVIDDIADRKHDCDVLLDQNFYAGSKERYINKVPKRCQLLLGPHFALLRDEFRQMHEIIKPRKGTVRRILVFFGGVDAENYTGRVIDSLSEINTNGMNIDVVVGAQHNCLEKILSACDQYGYVCHVQTNKMAALMMDADLSIGAGGSTIWERCCLGLPTLVFCTADNQYKQIADAAKEGLVYSISNDIDLAVAINNHVTSLFENDYLRQHLSQCAMKFVDGRGVLRVIGSLDCSELEVREANIKDSDNMFEWRNHESIRAVSNNKELITWEEHNKWFISVVDSKSKVLLIGYKENVPVGVVRFDKHEEEAEISIYLVPDANHSGQGRNLLLSAEQWIKRKWPDVKCIRANTLGENINSHRLFLGSSYHINITHYMKRL